MDIIEKNIIGRICEARKKLGIKQFELAKRIGLTPTAMSMIVVGKSKLTDKNIKLLCTAMSVDEQWLRTGEGGMFVSASPYEKEFLNVFDRLTGENQEFLLELAQALLKKQEKEQARYNIRT